ncbi:MULTISPECIES: hypothetical protein [Cohnella]|uniref:hypothetical protein n=1 Tax=Cohnella TaxID=329857 RepID=UPI000E39AFC0|nr:hypothetical protein [Cohnella sp.]REK68691.1 MAG: hypothetical protein C6P35_00345 [Cohnella sp.]
MSRSWERMVERNTKQLNKRRKKEGKQALSVSGARVEVFKGRSYIVPILLLLVAALFVVISGPWSNTYEYSETLFWVTVGCYLLLALVYFLRRPYLSISRDTLETRRFTGYKRLKPLEIRKIVQQPGYIVIETVKGGNWVFSKWMNRFPIEAMGERLQEYAKTHRIEWEHRTGK